MLLSSETPEFYHVVHLLRDLHPRLRIMAVYAANFWDDERLEEAAANGDLPGLPGELKPKAAAILKLVSDRNEPMMFVE
jgi:hypothetical protein